MLILMRFLDKFKFCLKAIFSEFGIFGICQHFKTIYFVSGHWNEGPMEGAPPFGGPPGFGGNEAGFDNFDE